MDRVILCGGWPNVVPHRQGAPGALVHYIVDVGAAGVICVTGSSPS